MGVCRAAPATGDPRVHRTPHSRERGIVLVPLTRYPGPVQVFKQVLAHREPKLVTPSGYAWLFVLAVELRLVPGTNDTALRPGEVAEFATSTPHWFGPAHAEAVEILHLFGPTATSPSTARTQAPRARQVPRSAGSSASHDGVPTASACAEGG
ncbi:hypothetical protein AB0E25_26940 [Streptomyces bobili]|uniref:hypothetical protein n=1 Tax=Streptomyces bobili TaxID=67280 RepID=UPI0033D002A1